MSKFKVTRLNTIESGGFYQNENHTGRESIFLDRTSKDIINDILQLEADMMHDSRLIKLGLSDKVEADVFREARRIIKAHTDSLKSHLDGKENIIKNIDDVIEMCLSREEVFSKQEKERYAGRGVAIVTEDNVDKTSTYKYDFSTIPEWSTNTRSSANKQRIDPAIYGSGLLKPHEEDRYATVPSLIVFLGDSLCKSDIEPLFGLADITVFFPIYDNDYKGRYDQLVKHLVDSKVEVYRYE